MAEIKDGGAIQRIKDFFAEQAQFNKERMLGEAQAQRGAAEMMPTEAQVAWGAAQLAPGAASFDLSGGMVTPPGKDVKLQDLPEYMVEGEKLPSFAENVERGGWGYVDAALQGLGSLGDVVSAVPIVGAPLGAAMKVPALVGKIARAADRGIGGLPRAGAKTDSAPNRLNIDYDKNLPKEMTEIQTRFADQLNSDIDGAIEQYRNLPDSDGGRIINTDVARELSPDYVADRTLSAAVHEPASAFTKEHYARSLAEESKPGQFNEVLFTGGGTGAGKSTALEDALLEKSVGAQIIYDTNLAGFPSSMKKMDEALAAGKDVTIAYVYRHPIEALTGGALTRAVRQEKEFGTGRTVPVNVHVNTHVRSIETAKDLAKHYDGNPKVDIRVIDNTGGKGQAFDAGDDLSILPEYDYNELLKEATDELNKALKEGKISQKVYEGFVPTKAGS